MTSDEKGSATALPQPATSWRALAKWIAAAILALLGVVLLISTKSTAGGALVVAAALVLLPVQRLGKGQRIAQWVRAGLVGTLVALAIASVAGTDLPPDQAKTGVKFLDQVLAIWQRFQDNLFGRTPPPRR